MSPSQLIWTKTQINMEKIPFIVCRGVTSCVVRTWCKTTFTLVSFRFKMHNFCYGYACRLHYSAYSTLENRDFGKRCRACFSLKTLELHFNVWMNEWMRHLYSALLCMVVHPKRFTIMWGLGLSSTTTIVAASTWMMRRQPQDKQAKLWWEVE